ncbi:hypothetical protein GQ457_11G025030 [Hibiscus cannabinus]
MEGCREAIKGFFSNHAGNKSDISLKLRKLKGVLKKWNKECCENIYSKVHNLEQIINELEEGVTGGSMEAKIKGGMVINRKLPFNVNVSFITLIPKVSNPIDISDYRPISLIGSIYKIIAMILSRRLRQVMDVLISDTQCAFVLGRQIFDGVLIASELIHSMKEDASVGGDGVIRALSSRPIQEGNIIFAGISAIKIALEVLKTTGWAGKISLVMELDCKVILDWIANPLRCLWRWGKSLAEVDCLVSQIKSIRFDYISRHVNIVAICLAGDCLYRNDCLQHGGRSWRKISLSGCCVLTKLCCLLRGWSVLGCLKLGSLSRDFVW